MQRLNRKNRTNQPTPEPSSTPDEAPTGTAVAEDPNMSDSQLPALNQGFLATLGGYEKHEAIKYQSDNEGSPFRFLRFYSSKANNAVEVKIALGKTIQEGHPYVSCKDEIIDVSRARFAVLSETPHWVTTDQSFAPDRCWTEPQPWGKKVGDQKVKESMAAIVLVFPEDGPCFTAMAECRTTKVPFVKDYLKGVDRTVSPQSDEDKALVKKLGSLMQIPPRFRQLVTLNMIPKTGGGFAYALAKGIVEPVTFGELEALNAWGGSAEAQEERESIERLYTKKVEEINDLASKTKD